MIPPLQIIEFKLRPRKVLQAVVTCSEITRAEEQYIAVALSCGWPRRGAISAFTIFRHDKCENIVAYTAREFLSYYSRKKCSLCYSYAQARRLLM